MTSPLTQLPHALAFEKWHGLGNDFVVVLDPAAHAWWADNAPRLCDRHRGIGADGILLITPETPRMRVINADGSVAEMCGNGIRCAAAALARMQKLDTLHTTFATDAGPQPVTAQVESNGLWTVHVQAGTPSFVARHAGVDSDASDLWLQAQGLDGLVGSVGNPHWIFFEHPGPEALRSVGPTLEHDLRFAKRTNVEFVTALGDNAWQVDVWERGVGITQACGTGATTVAAALVRTGRAPVDTPLQLHLPGGPLEIRVQQDGSAQVRGPAQAVFQGTVTR